MAHCTEEVSSFFPTNNKQPSMQDRSREEINQLQLHAKTLQQGHSIQNCEGEQPTEERTKSVQESTNESKDKNSVENAKSTVTKVTAESDQYTEWLIKIQLQYIENDSQLVNLFQQFEIGKKKSFDLQMENEKLSSDKEKVILTSSETLTKVKNTWQVCNDLSNYHKKLQFFKEKEIDDSIDGVVTENEKLSVTLKQLSESCIAIIESYKKESEHLKKIVQEEDHQRISMLKEVNSIFEKEKTAYEEELRLYKYEEDRNFALTSEYNNLIRSMEEEALKLKEEIKIANESLCSYASKNKILEAEINSCKYRELELEEAFQTAVQLRDSLKDECSALEEQSKTIDSTGAALHEELVKAKGKLSDLELEYNEKTIQLESSEKRKIDLLQQKVSSENELQTVKERLEDIKNNDFLASQEVTDLKLTLENIQSEYEASSDKYLAELSHLENELAEITTQLEIKSIDSKEEKTKKDDLLTKLDESNKELKILESEYQLAKTSAVEECTKLNELQTFIEEEKLKSEDLNHILLLTQNDIENKKTELERMHKESTNYEDEMTKTIDHIKQEINDVKEKQKITVSECNEKRQTIMKDLDECRNNSMKKSNEIDADINRIREENTVLKEKLSKLFSEKESIQRETKVEIKALEDRIKALKKEINNVDIVPQDWINSSSDTINLKQAPPTPLPTPAMQVFMAPPSITNITSSQPAMKHRYGGSDSSQSSVDFEAYMTRLNSRENRNPKKRRFTIMSSSQPAMRQHEQTHEPYHKAAHISLPRQQKTDRNSKGKRHEPLDLLSTL